MQTQANDYNMCMHPDCTENDLLPAVCSNCNKKYCSKHLHFSDHDCAKRPDAQVPTCPLCNQPVPLTKEGESADRAVSRHIDAGCRNDSGKISATRTNFCSFGNCTRNEITLMVCERCKQSFCLHHRLPAQHRCAVPSPPPQKGRLPSPEAQAAALDKEKVKITKARRPALKLSEMRMQNTKATAVGANKISDSAQGMTLRVFFPEDLVLKPMYFAFTKASPVGRVLDSVCNYADIRNANNNTTDESERWHLFLLKNSMCMPSSVSIQEMGLEDNDAIMLHKGSDLPAHLVHQIEELRSEARKSNSDCSVM